MLRLTAQPQSVFSSLRATIADLLTQTESSETYWEPTERQLTAIQSEADVLGYGGAAGGGKTDLLLGLAGFYHHRAVIFRRVFPSMRGMIDRSRQIFNATGSAASRDSFNEGLHIWRLRSGRQIEFGHLQLEEDRKKHQGQARDFFGFDELTEFSESQFRFVTAWNRSTHIDPTTGKPQRCRIVATFNPPTDEAGDWVTRYFAPWLDPEHPNPAKPGELRYYAMVKGEEVERPNGEPFMVDGEERPVTPKSRTFIPALLKDNPYLMATGYEDTINALPEPLRSKLKGNFHAGRTADPWQVIPAAWVRAAQARWTEQPPEESKDAQPVVGVDVARGGADKTVIARKRARWFAPLQKLPGASTPDGPSVVGLLADDIAQEAVLGIDIIGVGSGVCDTLAMQDISYQAINFANGTTETDKSGKLRLRNVRAAAYWKLREALDPLHGEELALPPDPELLADLCSAKWKLSAGGITLESKDDIKERIGRSPDCGDAVALAHYAAGRSNVCIAII